MSSTLKQYHANRYQDHKIDYKKKYLENKEKQKKYQKDYRIRNLARITAPVKCEYCDDTYQLYTIKIHTKSIYHNEQYRAYHNLSDDNGIGKYVKPAVES